MCQHATIFSLSDTSQRVAANFQFYMKATKKSNEEKPTAMGKDMTWAKDEYKDAENLGINVQQLFQTRT